MKFCPKCGSLMMPRRESDRTLLACMRCGHVENAPDTPQSYSLTTRVEHSNREKTVVIDESVNLPKTAPTAKGVECPKCGHTEAYYWIVQTRAADEPPTRIYRCTKCNASWREYE